MSFSFRRLPLRRWSTIAAVLLLAGCAIAKPRTDDPLEKYNRAAYQFNDSVDKVVVRPVALGYRKVTNAPVRRSFSDFFTNIRMPVTVANDLLQARPKQALENTGRFLINLTLGIGGFFDPASQLGLPLEDNDFGITLARWGVPEGDYLVLPLLGPNTVRDIWQHSGRQLFLRPADAVRQQPPLQRPAVSRRRRCTSSPSARARSTRKASCSRLTIPTCSYATPIGSSGFTRSTMAIRRSTSSRRCRGWTNRTSIPKNCWTSSTSGKTINRPRPAAT